MKRLNIFTLAAIAAFCLGFTAPGARAQVSVGVQIGSPPDCPYGYFDYPPYDCAPFGYYGPQWFQGGVFLGAGPWYRGPDDFDGWVNRHYDPRYGYQGPLPRRGERPDWDRHRGWEQSFHGDDRRHEVRHEEGNRYGQEQDRRDNGDGYGQEQRRDDNGNGYGQQQRRDDNGNGYGQQQRRDDNGNGYGQEQRRNENGGQYRQQQERRDNDNHNGQYQQRDNHSNARDNGRDNNGHDHNGRDNNGHDNGNHHDDDGH